MAFTAQQIHDIKKHLGVHPKSTIMDPLISTLQDGSTLETNTVTAITTANTAFTAIQTAQTEADDIVEGGGARFNYHGRIAIKKQQYRDAVVELARLVGWPIPTNGAILGVAVT